MDDEGLLCGKRIYGDRSGVGNCWKIVHADDLPAIVRMEIEGAIIDDGIETCGEFVASNGRRYRW